MSEQPKNEKNWIEEIEVATNQVVDRVRELVGEGNVRRIIIRKPNDEVLMEIPLVAGAVIGGVMVYIAPMVVALAALAGIVTKMKLEIVREGQAPEVPASTGKSKVQINVETDDTTD